MLFRNFVEDVDCVFGKKNLEKTPQEVCSSHLPTKVGLWRSSMGSGVGLIEGIGQVLSIISLRSSCSVATPFCLASRARDA